MKIKLVVLLQLLLCNAFGQSDSLTKVNWKFKIDSTYNALIKKNKIVGASIAIIDDGEIVYADGFGYQNRSQEIKADSNTIYRIGSISKSFTDLAIMQLNEQGRLKIDEPIQNYLPALKIKSRFSEENPILIGDVMSHTAGLPSDLLNGFFCDNPPTIDWVIEQLNLCTMAAPARYQHSYSNVGYGLLGRLIEEVSGLTYNDYLYKYVFEPMNMQSSAVTLTEIHQKQLSKGYVDGKETDETQIRDAAAGLISCSVMDMGNYIKMYLGNGTFDGTQILSEQSVAEMRKNRTGDITLPTPAEWGYGLYTNPISIISEKDTLHAKIVGHGGDTWAFHADFQFIPELGIGAVILTNSDNGTQISSAKSLLRQYLELKHNQRLVASLDTLNKKTYADQACAFEDVIGTYFYGGVKIEVDRSDKIKMKQGMHSIVFKEKSEPLTYTGKIRLFGFIPMKLKNQEFKFVKHNGEIFLKGLNPTTKKEDYLSKKVLIKELPQSWQSALGKYEVVGSTYPCKDCPYLNFETFRFSLNTKNGVLVAKTKGKSKDTKDLVAFVVVSDDVSVTPGIGRNTGSTLRILANGNLFYEGFELRRL